MYAIFRFFNEFNGKFHTPNMKKMKIANQADQHIKYLYNILRRRKFTGHKFLTLFYNKCHCIGRCPLLSR